MGQGPPGQEIIANSSPAKLAQVIAPWPNQKMGMVVPGADVFPSKAAPIILLGPRSNDLHKLGWRGVGNNFLPGGALAPEAVAKGVSSIRGF